MSHAMTWRFVVWLVVLFLFYLICPRENGLRSGISYLEHLEFQHMQSQGLERTQSRCHSEAQGSRQCVPYNKMLRKQRALSRRGEGSD